MDLHGATFYHLSILSFLKNIYTTLIKLPLKLPVEPIKLSRTRNILKYLN